MLRTWPLSLALLVILVPAPVAAKPSTLTSLIHQCAAARTDGCSAARDTLVRVMLGNAGVTPEDERFAGQLAGAATTFIAGGGVSSAQLAAVRFECGAGNEERCRVLARVLTSLFAAQDAQLVRSCDAALARDLAATIIRLFDSGERG